MNVSYNAVAKVILTDIHVALSSIAHCLSTNVGVNLLWNTFEIKQTQTFIAHYGLIFTKWN